MHKELRHPWEPQERHASHRLTYAPNPLGGVARDYYEPIRNIAKAFVARAYQNEIAGDNRDVEALAFWIGATAALRATGQGALAEDMAKLGVIEVVPRGFQAIFDLSLA